MSKVTRNPKIRSEEEAGAYLFGLINTEKERGVPYSRFDLEAIRRLVDRLDQPQAGLSVIHLAGSKGKGSTALMVESLLGALGKRVGTFTSPHLERWTERFRIAGREVTGEALAAAVEQVAPHVDAMREEDPSHAPTFFDATTAVALLLFKEAGVDHCVFEVGLGGRLDSTNVVTPAVTCITGIELEHTEQLGNTLAAIATEKAGIFKPGVPAVVADLADEPRQAVEARAAEVGAPLSVLGRDFGVEILDGDLAGQLLSLRDGSLRLEARLPVLGSHQASNAALALACVTRVVSETSGPEFSECMARGIEAVSLPGRLELISRSPWLLIDSAHTAQSAVALAGVLKQIPCRRAHFVLSVSAGKNVETILKSLLPYADEVTVTRADPIRSLSPSEVSKAIRTIAPDVSVTVVPNPHLAIRAAREGLGCEDLLCVAGSVYLAGIARHVLNDSTSAQRVQVSRRSAT
jgi:dihydrofolate synthase/folylpolyglutamate synthase